MEYQDIISTLALTLGVAWASGINLYATILMLGLLANTGNMNLPPDLQILADPMVIGAAGFMYCVEFFADKIPGVDNGWDAIHTFVRIPAGALLAAGAVGDINPVMQLSAAILGGGLTAGVHATKAGSRVMINTSPEPFSNWGASIAEDVAVVAGLWAAVNYPLLLIVFMIVFIALMIWLLPRLWRGIKQVFRTLSRWIRGGNEEPPSRITPPTIYPESQPPTGSGSA